MSKTSTLTIYFKNTHNLHMTNIEVHLNVEPKQMTVLSQQKLLQCIIQSLSHISVSYAVC